MIIEHTVNIPRRNKILLCLRELSNVGLSLVHVRMQALGWGEDSLVEEGMSGAGVALPKSPDADSLLDLEHDVTYEPQFTPEIELLITLARRWANVALAFVLGAITYGTIASAVLLWREDDLTDDKLDRFYTGATTTAVLSLPL